MPNRPPTCELCPRPRRSGASTVTASPRWRATGVQERCEPVMPCTSRTIGISGLPSGAPATPTWRTPPTTGTASAVWNGWAIRPAWHTRSGYRLRAPLDDVAADGLRGGNARQLDVLDRQVGYHGLTELGAQGLVVQDLEEA